MSLFSLKQQQATQHVRRASSSSSSSSSTISTYSSTSSSNRSSSAGAHSNTDRLSFSPSLSPVDSASGTPPSSSTTTTTTTSSTGTGGDSSSARTDSVSAASSASSLKRKTSQTTLGNVLESPSKKSRPDTHTSPPGDPSDVLASAAREAELARMSLSKKATTPTAAKKLVIKPFKVAPTLPDNFEDDTWATLSAAVSAIHTSTPVNTSLEELYKMVENLCAHKMSAKLYTRLEALVRDHVMSLGSRLTGSSMSGTSFLDLVNATWTDHVQQMTLIRQIFLVLDRTYVMMSTSVKSLWDMGIGLFRTHAFSVEEVSLKTVDGLLHLIRCERNGEVVSRALLLSLTRMLSALGVYEQVFASPFLSSTASYYTIAAGTQANELSLPTYLEWVESVLSAENDRVNQYLDAGTRKPLVAVLELHIIQTHMTSLIDRGFDRLLDDDRRTDIARLYNLFARVGGSGAVKTAFVQYVKKRGVEIVLDESNDDSLVQRLLDFKARMDETLERSFGSRDSFRYALKEAFEALINARQNKPAELIAKFIDSKLRSSGHKGASEEQLEVVLDSVMTLFRFINGKDIFEAFYKKDLAKRLLLQRSASADAEKSMISKLKNECGASFTSKLEGMFKDIDLSQDIMTSFKQSNRAGKKLDIDLHVNVLTMGFWPTYPPQEVNLPANLADAAGTFRAFYLSKHCGRSLRFQNNLGQTVLRANFPKGKKELDVSVFQTLVLLLFNQSDSISLADIRTATKIDDKELRVTLQSLACGKIETRVLTKNPKGKDVGDDDVFTYKADFTHKLIRVKINQIQMKETVEENTATNEKVFQDRQYQLDAAIVRIMKTRKQLSHQLLLAECFSQLKFPFQSADVKKRIESLIDREYLERDKTIPQTYNYLA